MIASKIKSDIRLLLFRRVWKRRFPGSHIVPRNVFGVDNVGVGRGSYGAVRIVTSSRNPKVRIGAWCSFADITIVCGNEHPMDRISTYPFKAKLLRECRGEGVPKGDRGVTICDDVWVGYNAVILDGVTLGRGCVVGAGAVVARDVPPYAVAVGNPARVVKFRFPEEMAARLMSLDFDRLDEGYARSHVELLYEPLTPDLLDRFEAELGAADEP